MNDHQLALDPSVEALTHEEKKERAKSITPKPPPESVTLYVCGCGSMSLSPIEAGHLIGYPNEFGLSNCPCVSGGMPRPYKLALPPRRVRPHGYKGTQRQRVLSMLKDAGSQGVTTSDFLREHLPRFGARILELRKLGYEIDTTPIRSGSFRYTLIEEREGV